MTDNNEAPGCGGNAARAREYLAEAASAPTLAQTRPHRQSVTLKYPSGPSLRLDSESVDLILRLAEAGKGGLLLEGEDVEAAHLLWLDNLPLWLGPRDPRKLMQAGLWPEVEVEMGETQPG